MLRRFTSIGRFPATAMSWVAALLFVGVAVFLLTAATARPGHAHSVRDDQHSVTDTSQDSQADSGIGGLRSPYSAVDVDLGERQHNDDSNCPHGPLNATCSAGGAHCMASGEQTLAFDADGDASPTIRLTVHASGLPPSPLDRPPR